MKLLVHIGEKIIIMSATIVNEKTFRDTLGISDDEVSFISLPSPFPKENRPVIFSPVGSMSAKMIDEIDQKNLNEVQEAVEEQRKKAEEAQKVNKCAHP